MKSPRNPLSFSLLRRRAAPTRLAVAAFAALCLLPPALAPSSSSAQNLPGLGEPERQELSPITERKLGDQIMRSFRRDRDYLDDAPLLEYLNRLGGTLIAARPDARGEAGFDFYFFGVRDPTLNAFALPGGNVGVHSGLVLAAQTESELASVMSHEIGHVAQRHIARMLSKQRQDSLISMAGMILAALAARSSPDASSALMLGGEGIALQRQLNFSREAEREADRVGLQIMRDAGFDTSGMISFFGRMQNATRAYSDAAPAFLRSHPLTTERIADIEARTRDFRYKQRADSLDFYLIKARLRVLQDDSVRGLREAADFFADQMEQKGRPQVAAARYGLALIAYKRGEHERAQALLQEVRAILPPASRQNAVLASFAIDLKLALRQPAEAVKEAQAARSQFPLSRGIAMQYADALLAAGRNDEAVSFLRDQAQQYRSDQHVQDRLARAYSAQGKQALQHLALAESYALAGSYSSALDQLSIARRAPDASFYDQAQIDARERELQAQYKEELRERGKER